ncbi:MAG TPA: hypothetical protein VL131_05940 [Gammaproteobacteria bacterium]|nr:hypothetical protein [Gammaproteobacteria bacterium]
MRIQLGVPEELDDHERRDALDAALEATTISNEAMVKRGLVPTAAKAIKAGRVKWQPEPPGDEHFDLAPTVLKRGHGDCDDLAPWHAGSLRATGTDPDAVAFVRRSGPNRWHALVRRGDGSIEDPSLAAGMGTSVSGDGSDVSVVGAIVKPMASDPRMCLAICPHRTDPRSPAVWLARLDVPSAAEPWDWSSQSGSHDPRAALTQAIQGARLIAEDDIEGEDDARLAVLHDIVNGADPYEVGCALEELHGDELDTTRLLVEGMNVGNFFHNLAHGLKKFARPFAAIASKAVQFVPGVGPIASSALDMAAKLLPRDHPAHPANAGHPAHAAAVKALVAQNHPAYAGAVPQQGSPAAAPQNAAPWHASTTPWLWEPHWSFQPGQPFYPWGPSSPAVMRF